MCQFRAHQNPLHISFRACHSRYEIAGLNLVVQSDAPDFDLWAQVLMVLLDGSAVNLEEDIRRARFRNSYFKNELLKPAQVVKIRFDFCWMARRIPAGVRCASQSVPSPYDQKNYVTGGLNGL